MSNGDRWPRVRELFERVFEESPADVEDWLDQEGVTDALLREEVVSLVRHHKVAGSFLAQDAGQRLSQFMGDGRVLEPGQMIGQYTIVRELGPVVWAASTWQKAAAPNGWSRSRLSR